MDNTKLEVILGYYSPEAQTIKAVEELAELQKELTKLLLGKGDVRKLTDEVADVYIMLAQICVIFDIDIEELESWIKYKLDRQIARIDADKALKDAVKKKVKDSGKPQTDCAWKQEEQ